MSAPPSGVTLRRGARHSLLLARRHLVKFVTSPEQVIGIVAQPTLFVLLFVFILGGAIADSTEDYLQYALPGILVQSVVFSTTLTGFSLNGDVAEGIFDRFRSLPIARSAPLVGQVMADVVRFAVAAGVIVVLGVAFGFRVTTHLWAVPVTVGLVLVFAFATSWVSCFAGLVVNGTEALATVGIIWILPLTFGSSVLAPPETMPGWVQAWARVNPVSHLSDAARGLLTGGPVAEGVAWTLAWSAALLAAFVPLSVWAYQRRV